MCIDLHKFLAPREALLATGSYLQAHLSVIDMVPNRSYHEVHWQKIIGTPTSKSCQPLITKGSSNRFLLTSPSPRDRRGTKLFLPYETQETNFRYTK